MPEAARLLVRQGAQLLCCPANYGGPWTTQLARIRAMENATPLICANRTGVKMYAGAEATFRGESQIVGPMGEVWTSATEETSLGLSIIDPVAHVLKANPMCDDLMEEASRYALSGPHPK
jgi:omega-amidase